MGTHRGQTVGSFFPREKDSLGSSLSLWGISVDCAHLPGGHHMPCPEGIVSHIMGGTVYPVWGATCPGNGDHAFAWVCGMHRAPRWGGQCALS